MSPKTPPEKIAYLDFKIEVDGAMSCFVTKEMMTEELFDNLCKTAKRLVFDGTRANIKESPHA